MYSKPGKVKLRTFLRFTKQGLNTAQDEHAKFSFLCAQNGEDYFVGVWIVLPPFCHSAIPPFRHSAIPPFCHSAIPPFRHSAIPPFRHSAIPPFLGRNPTKPRKGSMFCGKNSEIVSVRYRHHLRSSDACVG
jgi:hypothetical protein